jgi:hypothetical protein
VGGEAIALGAEVTFTVPDTGLHVVLAGDVHDLSGPLDVVASTGHGAAWRVALYTPGSLHVGARGHGAAAIPAGSLLRIAHSESQVRGALTGRLGCWGPQAAITS